MKINVLTYLLAIFFLMLNYCCSTDAELPTIHWNGDAKKPLVFYISGDAGFSTFTKNMGNDFSKKGYETYALNTRKYFWQQKTPNEAATAVQNFLKSKINSRANPHVLLVGFSFGADVTPFIYNRLQDSVKAAVQKVFIIGPSKSNDFKIHLTEYFGMEPKGSLQVIPEINKIKNVPVEVILSDFEFSHFPYSQITLKNDYKMVHLPGDHHYNGKTGMLTGFIINQ